MSLEFGYIALSIIMTIVLFLIGNQAIQKSTPKAYQLRNQLILGLGLIAWHTYSYFIGGTKIIADFNFPPKFAVLLIFPCFIFTAVFLHFNRKKKWISSISMKWLVLYQACRIFIETLFAFSVEKGILPEQVTIKGYNYDMIFGFTALFIFAGVFLFKFLPKKSLLAWNVLGLLVIASIIFLFQASVLKPEIFGEGAQALKAEAVRYPYVLIAGYLMPSAVFIHFLSIVKIGQENKQTS